MRQKKFDLKELKKRFLHKKTLIPVLICAVAVLFLAFGFGSGNKETVAEAESTSVERYVADIERRLCELLSKIDGVGRCEVMITVSTSERSVFLSDTEKNGDNSSTSHIKIKTGGNEQAVAEFRYMPALAARRTSSSRGSATRPIRGRSSSARAREASASEAKLPKSSAAFSA